MEKIIGHNLHYIIFLLIAILYIQQQGVFDNMQLFSVFPTETIKQGEGKVPYGLEIGNEILDFDRNEFQIDWNFKMSSTYYVCLENFCSLSEIKSVVTYYVVKVDGMIVGTGKDINKRTNPSEKSEEWVISGTASISNNLTAGRHYMTIMASTLPEDRWQLSSYGGTPAQLNGNFYTRYCNSQMATDTELTCFEKRCSYYQSDWTPDLSNKKFCQKNIGTCYQTCQNTYTSDCNKCGIESTQLNQVFSGYERSYICNYDKCFAECYTGGTRDITRSQSFNCYVQGQSALGTEYPKNIIGYNYQNTCKSCIVIEQCNPYSCELNTTNPLSAIPTITELKKDFIVCRDNICLSTTNSTEYQLALDKINSLETDISEKIALINKLNATLEEKARILRELNLSLSQQATMIESFTSELNEQAQIINNLSLNLEQKAILISQLTSTNTEQAELIKKMELSFTEQGEIITNLKLNIDDDASLIKLLSNSTDDTAKIIAGMKLELAKEMELVAKLKGTIQEQEELMRKIQEEKGTTDYSILWLLGLAGAGIIFFRKEIGF